MTEWSISFQGQRQQVLEILEARVTQIKVEDPQDADIADDVLTLVKKVCESQEADLGRGVIQVSAHGKSRQIEGRTHRSVSLYVTTHLPPAKPLTDRSGSTSRGPAHTRLRSQTPG